jgi:hypothetical protein
MSLPAIYFDVAGAAIGGGYRVIFIKDRALQEQIIIDTAGDVAAAAKLCGAAVLTSQLDVRQACRERGVRLLDNRGERER